MRFCYERESTDLREKFGNFEWPCQAVDLIHEKRHSRFSGPNAQFIQLFQRINLGKFQISSDNVTFASNPHEVISFTIAEILLSSIT